MLTGENAPGMAAEAMITLRNRSSALAFELAAISPMFQ